MTSPKGKPAGANGGLHVSSADRKPAAHTPDQSSAQALTTTTDAILTEHAAVIRALGKRVIADVIEIGRRLSECKAACGHGNWLPWLEREFGWTDRTALNFMRVNELSLKSERLSDLPIDAWALYMLAAPSTPTEARTEVIDRAAHGERISHADVKDIVAAHRGIVTGVATHPHAERGLDLYETPNVATRALLNVETFSGPIWEPACGPGAIVRVLRDAGHHVVATDLVDYQCPQSLAGVDFLTQERAPEGVQQIITNPHYMHAGNFVRHALELVPRVAMLLRLTFLESEGRTDILDGGQLARVYLFRKRLPMMHRAGWDGPRIESSAIAFAWFVWDREHRGPTLLSRISWEEDSRATAPPDDDGLDIPAFLKREPAPAEASQQPADPPPLDQPTTNRHVVVIDRRTTNNNNTITNDGETEPRTTYIYAPVGQAW